jgi:RND family efflux transporter MFP subunit
MSVQALKVKVMSAISNIKKKFMKLNIYGKILIIILLIGVIWLSYTKIFVKKTAAVSYQTSAVQRGTLVSTVTASGQVSTANNTPIVTQVTGLIKKLYVKNGDQVKVGQPIAVLELDQSSTQKYIQQQSSYQSAVNSLESAKVTELSLKTDMLTAQDAFIKGALYKNKDKDSLTYKQLESDKKVAEDKYSNQSQVIKQVQLSLYSASLSLQNYSPTIYAPISGTITGLSLQEGSVIPAQAVSSSTQTLSQNIAVITTSKYPIVTINLSEIDVPKVKIGSKATVIFDAFPDSTFTGKVFSINTTGSVSSGVTTYPVTIILDTESTTIFSNMSATANIIIDSKDNVLYVPVSAVVNQNGQSAVRILMNNKLQYVPVETGISSDTDIEIMSGVGEGDGVVTTVINPTTGTSGTTGSSPFGIRTGGVGGMGGARFNRD